MAALRSLRGALSEGGAAGAAPAGSGRSTGSGGGAADPASVLEHVEQWLQRPHRWSAPGTGAGAGAGSDANGGAVGLARSLETAAGSLNHALVVVAAQAVEELCREAPGLRSRLRISGVSPPLMSYLDLASPLLLPGGGGVERPTTGVVVAACAGSLAALTALAADDPGRLELASYGAVRRCVRWLGDAANGRRPRVSCCAAQLLGELCVLDGPRAQLATKDGMEALLHALDAAGGDEASQGAIVRCLSALSAGASPAASAAFKPWATTATSITGPRAAAAAATNTESGTLPVLLRLLSNGGPCTEATGHAAQALAQLSALQFAKEELLRVGAVASLLRCLAAGPHSPVAHAAAHTLGNMCSHEATGREILRMQGPTSMQALLGLLRSGVGPATAMALRVVVNMAAHPALRPGLISAGALDALLPFLGVRTSPHWASGGGAGAGPASPGGSPRSGAASARMGDGGAGATAAALAGGGGGSLLVAGVEDEVGSPHELALLALVRCMAINGVGGPAAQGALLSGPVLQVLLEAAAAPLPQPPTAVAVPAGGVGGLGGLQVAAATVGEVATGASLPPSVAVVVEASETLAELSKGSTGALRMLEVQTHLVLLQRLLAIMASAPGAQVSTLDGVQRRLLDACVRGMANVCMAVPAHPDLRLARVHEALLHVLLAFGVAVKPGVLALQALCALATDSNCARDLLSLGLLPPVVKALEGLAAAQHLRRSSAMATSAGAAAAGAGGPSTAAAADLPGTAAAAAAAARGGGLLGVGPVDGSASAFAASAATGKILGGGWHSPAVEVEVAHLLGLLLQNISAHKALASRAVAGGAVKAICEWLGACAANGDVEGAVLCCATLCLLGDGDQAALADIVRYDGIEHMVDMLHPRWATAALVPSTVAAAVAVSCRWGASAQAFRMAGGIPALADTLLGAHGLACCRPVVNAIRALVANDPPSSREIRTTNTVIALGTQLQLLPNNDPRSGLIRDLLRLLGEDPDTAMRLSNTKNTSALATAHAHAQAQALARSESIDGGPGAASAAGGGGGGGHGHRHHPRVSGGGGPPMRVSGSGISAYGSGGGGGGRKHHSPHHHHHHHGHHGHGGPATAASGFTSDSSGGAGRIQRHRTSQSLSTGLGDGGGSGDWSPPAALGPAAGGGGMLTLADMLGGTSYKSLRRASLQQLAKRLDADDFSDAEEDVEDYIAGLEEDPPSSSEGLEPAASGAADAVTSLPADLALQPPQQPPQLQQPQQQLTASGRPGSAGGAAASSSSQPVGPVGPSPFTTNGVFMEQPKPPAPAPASAAIVTPAPVATASPVTARPPIPAPAVPPPPPPLPPPAVALAKAAAATHGANGPSSGSVAGTSASEEDTVDVASLSEAAFVKAPPPATPPAATSTPQPSPIQLAPSAVAAAGTVLAPRPSPQLQAPAPSPALDSVAAEMAAVMRAQQEALERQITELRQQLEEQQRAMAAQLQMQQMQMQMHLQQQYQQQQQQQQEQPTVQPAAVAHPPMPAPMAKANTMADEEAARLRWEEQQRLEAERRWQQEQLWETDQDQLWQQHPQQQNQQNQHHRRNPVISTLAAVNPLRLFRRGPKQQNQHQPALTPAVTAPAPSQLQAQPQQGGASRQSFQLDGDELVFWEPGQS
ncbi:hypothetical protein HYH02_009760 [Chlamydomonas schloesseri]|uniref:Uncharacterized protein n=1 Tax=Chlamydomonas schloesseri TaxID=2026947 RepID=A0A835TN72_9CHLO|nr:hypothetical protein HYH02_009760 [Chlamydomonas schloesseri]|eukprot:KAG2441966.1 hypothetical protein HYH02_009760 [Chlamydomonas schloesseri]